ncbi:MAG: TerC family protein, partial [Planctomycetales bacterium]|nr:TerC family protein [Planctomycetales bacterium]
MVNNLTVMITAVVLSIGIMVTFASKIGEFVHRHPTLKMLALSFLILIGVMLVAEGAGTHVNKGYIYFAMVFALLVEALNMRMRRRMPKLDPIHLVESKQV